MLSASSLPTLNTVDPADLVSVSAVHPLRSAYDSLSVDLSDHQANMIADDCAAVDMQTHDDVEFWRLLDVSSDPAVVARESADLNEWAESILEPYQP